MYLFYLILGLKTFLRESWKYNRRINTHETFDTLPTFPPRLELLHEILEILHSQVSESSPHDPLASLNSIDFHFLYLHEATAAYSCRVVFASGAEVRLSRSLRGTQTPGTEKWERPQEPKSWGWKSEERFSRNGWWHFQWTLLKTQSGLYLKSVEELQIGEKSPFLEIGTKWGKMSWSPEVGLPKPRWRGAIGWMNSEVPSGFMMLGD